MTDSTTVTSSASAGISPADHAAYLLGLADDSLVHGHRLSEWLSRAPQLEEDMAMGNLALDLLGQARSLLTRAGEVDETDRSEDDLAYFRDERDFRNVHLVEQPGTHDFGFEMARLLTMSALLSARYAALLGSADPVLAAVAAKAVKEVDYHRDHARHWVVRLGDGTDESHRRMQAALDTVAPYVDELFDDHPFEVAAADAGIGVLPSSLREGVLADIAATAREATLTVPEAEWRSRGGRLGIHSEPMGFMLAEMQHLARSHPGATW